MLFIWIFIIFSQIANGFRIHNYPSMFMNIVQDDLNDDSPVVASVISAIRDKLITNISQENIDKGLDIHLPRYPPTFHHVLGYFIYDDNDEGHVPKFDIEIYFQIFILYGQELCRRGKRDFASRMIILSGNQLNASMCDQMHIISSHTMRYMIFSFIFPLVSHLENLNAFAEEYGDTLPSVKFLFFLKMIIEMCVSINNSYYQDLLRQMVQVLYGLVISRDDSELLPDSPLFSALAAMLRWRGIRD